MLKIPAWAGKPDAHCDYLWSLASAHEVMRFFLHLKLFLKSSSGNTVLVTRSEAVKVALFFFK